MKIAIGSDHAGFAYKEKIRQHLAAKGHEVKDFGTFSDAQCDYPAFIRPVAQAVARTEFDRGIVLGGSGNGEAMVANRIPGIRCSLCWDLHPHASHDSTTTQTSSHSASECSPSKRPSRSSTSGLAPISSAAATSAASK